MCGRFTMATVDEVKAVARAIEYDEPLDLELVKPEDATHVAAKAFPGSEVPVLLTSAEQMRPLRIKYLTWGFPRGEGKGVFNTRLESAAQKPFWRESFETRHCIVPVQTFDEASQGELVVSEKTDKTVKQMYRFSDARGGVLLLAGIWKPGYFSLLTHDAEGLVSEVHDRMPIAVDLGGARSWLYEGVLEQHADVELTAERL